MTIVDLRHGQHGIGAVVIVVDLLPALSHNAACTTWRVADGTGAVHLTVFGPLGQAIRPGDIVRLDDAYCSLFKASLTLFVGLRARIHRISRFMMTFAETPNMSLYKWPPPKPEPGFNFNVVEADAAGIPPDLTLLNK